MNDAYSNPALPLSPGSQCPPLSENENELFSLSQMTPLVSTAACWGRDCPRGLDANSCLSEPLTAPGNPRNTSSVSTLSTPPVCEDYWVSGLLKCPLWPREKGHTITCEYPQLLQASALPAQLQSLWAFVLTWWKRKCREDFIRANEMLHQTLLAITLIIGITEWNEWKQIFLALSSYIWNGLKTKLKPAICDVKKLGHCQRCHATVLATKSLEQDSGMLGIRLVSVWAGAYVVNLPQ